MVQQYLVKSVPFVNQLWVSSSLDEHAVIPRWTFLSFLPFWIVVPFGIRSPGAAPPHDQHGMQGSWESNHANPPEVVCKSLREQTSLLGCWPTTNIEKLMEYVVF